MIKKPKKIIAVDFDGTLVHNKYPFCENPDMELIQFIKENRNKYIWILWTCRKDRQLKYAIDYMKDEHGIVFDYVNENVPWIIQEYGDSRKVYADYYIDNSNVSVKDLKQESLLFELVDLMADLNVQEIRSQENDTMLDNFLSAWKDECVRIIEKHK